MQKYLSPFFSSHFYCIRSAFYHSRFRAIKYSKCAQRLPFARNLARTPWGCAYSRHHAFRWFCKHRLVHVHPPVVLNHSLWCDYFTDNLLFILPMRCVCVFNVHGLNKYQLKAYADDTPYVTFKFIELIDFWKSNYFRSYQKNPDGIFRCVLTEFNCVFNKDMKSKQRLCFRRLPGTEGANGGIRKSRRAAPEITRVHNDSRIAAGPGQFRDYRVIFAWIQQVTDFTPRKPQQYSSNRLQNTTFSTAKFEIIP